jgi:type II secretory pathway pseudopilin PulG
MFFAMIKVPHVPPPAGSRAGFSLLEVLVACGILVIGLTSIAAILPAASSRLAEATAEDRAGTLAANAYAEAVARGLLSSDLFPASSSGTTCVVFGRVLTVNGTSTSIPGGKVALASGTTVSGTVLFTRIDQARGFVLEDDLTYSIPTTGETPNNSFLNSGTGPREYKDGVCWGGMLTPTVLTGTVGPGSVATLSLAVFKKSGSIQSLTLTPTSGYYSVLPADAQTRKTYAKGCSYLLVLPTSAAPTWQRINASWTVTGSTVLTGSTFLTFTGTQSFPKDTPAIGFEGLLRLDERTIVLD